MAGRTQPISQTNFGGGVNAVSSRYLLGQNQLSRVRNMLLDERGSIRTRDGYSIISTSPDTTNPLLYIGVLNKNDGSSTRYAIQYGNPANTLYRMDDTPWTSVGTFSGAELTPQSVTVLDNDVIACGYETPKKFDGNTLTPITAGAGQSVPMGAKHLAYHLGSVWLWNTAPNTSTLDGPSSLRVSQVKYPLVHTDDVVGDWPDGNQLFIAKDDGQVGMGMSSFTIAESGISPTQTLVLFKNYSGYQVTGTIDAGTASSNFSVQRIKSDMGCIAPRTIQFVSGYGIIRLSHKGFALFDGVNDTLLSEEIRPYVFGIGYPNYITPLNQSSVYRAWAVQSQNPPLYIAACPVGGNALSRVLVYDLVNKAWTICDFPINFQCLSLILSATSFPTVYAGTDTGGTVVRLFGGDVTDNGAAVAWSLVTRNFTTVSPSHPTYWRRVIFDGEVTPPQNLLFSVEVEGYATPITGTRAITGTPPGSVWGTAKWAAFTWGSPGVIDGRAGLDINRTAPSVALDLSGSGPVRVRSLEFHAKTKPPTGVLV